MKILKAFGEGPMNKFSPKLVATAFAAVLVAGCSSGGGTTSSGDGLGLQTTQGNLLLTASLIGDTDGEGSATEGTFSIDAFQTLCNPIGVSLGLDPVFDGPGQTALGTFTVTSRDLTDESGLTPVEFFPEGVNFTRYQVSYTSPNAFAPTLRDRVFQETFTLPNGNSTISINVVLADLDLIQNEFAVQSSGSPASYNARVQAFGQEFNGTPISVSAETFIEFVNFDSCTVADNGIAALNEEAEEEEAEEEAAAGISDEEL